MLSFRRASRPDADVHVAAIDGADGRAYKLVVHRDRGQRKWTARLLSDDKDVLVETRFFAPTAARAAEAAVNLVSADLTNKARVAAAVLPTLAPESVGAASREERRAAFAETRDEILRERALAATLAAMDGRRLPRNSVGRDFLDACVAGVVDHVTANLSWDEAPNEQLARAVETVFWPSLIHRYWTELDAALGDKPDVPPPERRAAVDVAELRRLMRKYVWR